jgi:hypothetical protein
VTSSTKGWILLGLGIVRHREYSTVLSNHDWQSILSSETPHLQTLDGHFVAVKWGSSKIQCFTDQLGLRTLYLAKLERGFALSSRLDWLARLASKSEIDFEIFGSAWLTFNQLSSESPMRGIHRLGPGGYAECTPSTIHIENRPWTPRFFKESDHSTTSILQALTRPRGMQTHYVSLGLSGGLDSRVLLALMLSNREREFYLHTFGNPEDPDVSISERLADSEALERIHFNDVVPSTDTCLAMLREYVGQAGVIEPASSILKLRYYSQLHAQQKMMIDGGFGEIGRRQYLNRLLLRGKKAIQAGKTELILPYLQMPRGFIFLEDIRNIMYRGTERQIQSIWDEMPDVNQFGVENFLDLFAVRTRFPNYGAPEQARLDTQIPNYMPYAQPSYLHAMFNTPVSQRRNGKAYRRIIRDQRPALVKFPLAKSGTTYPFSFGTLSAWFWTKAKSKAGFSFVDPAPIDLLSRLSEFIQDTVHSSELSYWAPYNHSSILHTVEQYYKGRKELAPQVDWWLAFEIWRKSMIADNR